MIIPDTFPTNRELVQMYARTQDSWFTIGDAVKFGSKYDMPSFAYRPQCYGIYRKHMNNLVTDGGLEMKRVYDGKRVRLYYRMVGE